GTDKNVFVKPSCIVMKGLPSAKIVNPRPGDARPAIVNLPVKRTRAARHDPPQVLGCSLDGFSLQHLTHVKKRLEAFGFRILPKNIRLQPPVTIGIFLMSQHDRRADILITGDGKGTDRPYLGK